MSDNEDALLQRALPRNLEERKRAIAVRSAEESVRKNRTEKTVHDLIYAIRLTDSIKKEFPMSFKILEKLFTEKYQPDETQPDKIIGITDFAIRRRPISMHFDTHRAPFELHTLKGTVEDSISWLSCFEGPATYKSKLISAMKLAVHSHFIDLEKGKETWTPADEFILKNDKRLARQSRKGAPKPTLFTKNEYHQWIFREEDADFKAAWLRHYESKPKKPCYTCHPEMRNRIDEDGWTLKTAGH